LLRFRFRFFGIAGDGKGNVDESDVVVVVAFVGASSNMGHLHIKVLLRALCSTADCCGAE
jgi:hypothetical protein